ncbi:hypothetical protein E3226_007500 [Legionella geestiana]|uniref:type IV secretion system protein VirB3 n=1 Tax=Legionella geestiana TaxID=45065 RepID=UPI001092C4E8|nr:VirB3 family type IV secretion system protein [Legionella geestiana]QDQ40251.1 hypothetical protein E3226_007500 [Legionella geestiana]
MRQEDEALDTSPLFGALTRPSMTMGVTLEYHTINLMVSVITFIALGSVFYLALFVPLHVFGWAVCSYDPQFFSILQKKLLHLPNVPNQSVWGVRSYEPF